MYNFEFDEDIYLTIRKNIKKHRQEKGITAAQLAESVELSHEFIRQLESNNRKYTLSVRTLYKIGVVLSVSLDKLIEKN